jgi:hypothetical protein
MSVTSTSFPLHLEYRLIRCQRCRGNNLFRTFAWLFRKSESSMYQPAIYCLSPKVTIDHICSEPYQPLPQPPPQCLSVRKANTGYHLNLDLSSTSESIVTNVQHRSDIPVEDGGLSYSFIWRARVGHSGEDGASLTTRK